jgi:hypothetical protein
LFIKGWANSIQRQWFFKKLMYIYCTKSYCDISAYTKCTLIKLTPSITLSYLFSPFFKTILNGFHYPIFIFNPLHPLLSLSTLQPEIRCWGKYDFIQKQCNLNKKQIEDYCLKSIFLRSWFGDGLYKICVITSYWVHSHRWRMLSDEHLILIVKSSGYSLSCKSQEQRSCPWTILVTDLFVHMQFLTFYTMEVTR